MCFQECFLNHSGSRPGLGYGAVRQQAVAASIVFNVNDIGCAAADRRGRAVAALVNTQPL